MREITAEDHERLKALMEKYKTGQRKYTVIDHLCYWPDDGGEWAVEYMYDRHDDARTALYPTAKEAIDEMEQILIKKYGEK